MLPGGLIGKIYLFIFNEKGFFFFLQFGHCYSFPVVIIMKKQSRKGVLSSDFSVILFLFSTKGLCRKVMLL